MFKVLAFGATNVGRERKNNEDAFRIAPDAGLFLVCDGMGGHASGEIASQIAADAMVRFIALEMHRPEFRWPIEVAHQMTDEARALDAAVRLANVEVYGSAAINPTHKGMGTTVVGLFAGKHRLGLVHVGDSRIYRLRGDELEQLTDDHSLLNHYIRTRPMSAQQIRQFAGKNVIVRAVGLRDAVEPDVQVQDYRAGDMYLLCSDGLTDMVDDEQIREALLGEPDNLETTAERLIELAMAAGGKDNITLVLLQVVEDSASRSIAPSSRRTEPMRSPFEDTSPGFDSRGTPRFSDDETLPEISVVSPAQWAPRMAEKTPDTMNRTWLGRIRAEGRDTPPAGMPRLTSNDGTRLDGPRADGWPSPVPFDRGVTPVETPQRGRFAVQVPPPPPPPLPLPVPPGETGARSADTPHRGVSGPMYGLVERTVPIDRKLLPERGPPTPGR